MKDIDKTKEQLIKKLVELRKRLTNLEKSKTERKRTEQALQESEQKYRALVESATDFIYMIDKNNKVLSVNRAAARLFGKSPTEITGKSIFDLFPEEIAKGYSKNLKKVFKTGTPRHSETKMIARGRESWISVSLSPVKDQKGNVIAVMGVTRDITERRRVEEELRKHRDRLEELVEKRTDELRRTNEQLQQDITERKRTEEKLKESEERYKTIFESASDVIFLIDKNGKILDINEKIKELTGYAREELVGKNIRKLTKITTRESLAIIVKNFMKRMAGMHVPPHEVEMIKKNGELINVEINAVAIKKDGKIVGDLAVIRDITERRQTEKALRDSEARGRALLNALPDLMFQINKNGIFLSYKGTQKDLYVPPEEFLGKKVDDVLPQEIAQRIMRFLKQLLQTGEEQIFDYQLPVKNKMRYWEARMVVSDEDTCLVIVRDITERKQAEEQLRESEERYRNTVELAPDGIITVNLKGVVTSCNPAFYKMTGFSKDEIIGKHFSKMPTLRRVGDVPYYLKIFNTIIKGKVPEYFEAAWRHRDGTIRLAEIRASIMKKERKTVGFQAIVRDITERKQTEEALRESVEMYKMLVKTSPDAVTATDLEGKITAVSQQTIELHGYGSAEELLGMNAFELIAPEDRKNAMKNLQRTLKEGIVRNLKYTVLKKDGYRFIGELNTALIKDAYGKPRAFIATTRDITKRSLAEETLRESEEKYRAAVEQSADNIYLLDVKTKRILESNAALQKLLGYSTEELQKLTVYDFVAHSRDDIAQKIKKIMRAKRAFLGERKYRRKDGSIVDVEVSAHFIILKGKKAFFVVSRDITERKQVEKALRESEEKYKTLTENVNVGIYRNSVGPKGQFIEANPAIIKMFGYNNKYEFFAINVADLYQNPRDRARFNQKMLTQGFVSNEELQLKKKDGTPFICSVSAVAVKDEQGKVVYYDGIIEDITERKQAEEALLESEQKFRGLYESVRDGIIMVDMEDNILECNQSFLDMVGYTEREIKKLTYKKLTPIRWHKYEENIVKKQVLKRGFSDEYEKEFIKKNGTKRSVTVTKWVIRNEQGKPIGMWSIVRDITERKRHEEELEYMASHDILTGLPNRMLFKDRLEQALKYSQRRGQQLAVMLLDLDRFKEINDSLGHDVGDQLLKHVGKRLSSVLRKGDTVARMGGDEFMLLLPEITKTDDAMIIAQKILIAIRTPLQVEQHELHITTSIGIAVHPNDGPDAATLMKNADIAMYWAKDKGRNDCQRFTKVMNAKKNS